MANLQTTIQTSTPPLRDHRSLIEAASRYYSEAVRLNDVQLLEKASQLAYQAWQADDRYLPGINLLARIAMHRGQYQNAKYWVDNGLSIKPDSPGLLYSAGHIALSTGQLDDAEEFFTASSRISQVATKSPMYLAHIKLLKGAYVDAFQIYRELIKTQANDAQVRSKLFEATDQIVADFYSVELEQELLRWFEFEDVDHSQLRSLTTSMLQHKMRLTEQGCPLDPEQIANDPLLLAGLQHFYFTDPLMEKLLTTLRRSLLLSSSRELAIPGGFLDLVTGLAAQCELNESVWFIDPQETTLLSQLNDLAARILSLGDVNASDISAIVLLTMMYQPLRHAPFFDALVAHDILWPTHMAELMDKCLQEPLTIRAHASCVRTINLSGDPISDQVRAQYEVHPYPRWTSLGYHQPADYLDTLASLFPGAQLPKRHEPINLLVAGCGTGRQAVRLSRYFHGLSVTALDLSKTSLGYAAMQAERYGCDIDFVHGDLLEAAQLNTQYDVIECSGVLHHMDHPEDGLQALTEQLASGGLMKIALYSRQARTLIRELRETLGEDLPTSESDIRLVRETLIQQGSEQWHAILQSPDFYSLSACRDLLFHTKEHTYDLQEVRRLIDNAGLEWVGMVAPQGAYKLAADVLKLKPQHLTLNDWHTLEQVNPALFAGMYQFYVRKP